MLRRDPGLPWAALPAARKKHRVSGEFWEFAQDPSPGPGPDPEPGLTDNGGFVRFLGSLGVCAARRAPGDQLGLIHRLSTSLLHLGSLGV